MSNFKNLFGLGGAGVVSPILPLLPGQLPTFGAGHFRCFMKSGTFIVPAGIIAIRLRGLAAGGSNLEDGGNSSFGALLTVIGGKKPSGTTPGVGGTGGTGGDFRAAGGPGGANWGGGGGAAGSELGVGGAGGAGGNGSTAYVGGGGGAVGGLAGASGTVGSHGASPFEAGNSAGPGMDIMGLRTGGDGLWNPTGLPFPFPMFSFTGGGGSGAVNGGSGGPGAGGGGGQGNGFNSSLGYSFSTGGGEGGWLGGGGGGANGGGGSGGRVRPYWQPDVANTGRFQNLIPSCYIGGGMGGNVIPSESPTAGLLVAGAGGGEYARGVFAVSPGDSFTVTVAPSTTNNPSSGLVLVEW